MNTLVDRCCRQSGVFRVYLAEKKPGRYTFFLRADFALESVMLSEAKKVRRD